MSDRLSEDMPHRMSEDMPDRMSEDMPDRMPDRMSEDMPHRMSEDMPDRMSEDMPDRMPDRLSEDMPDRMSEDMPDGMPDRLSEDMPHRMSEDMPDRMSEDMPDRMPDRLSEDMPDRMSEDMPDGMPDRLSEDMPDRMSEDMPDGMPDRLPDGMPDRLPEDMTDRMPEDMPDRISNRMPNRMPEGLPDWMADGMNWMPWWGSLEAKQFLSSFFSFLSYFRSISHALFRHLNFQKCSGTAILSAFWLENLLPTTAARIFGLSSDQMPLHPSPQQAYFANLRGQKAWNKHSVSRLFYLFAQLDLLSSSFLFFDSGHLCCVICQYCRKFDFSTLFGQRWKRRCWKLSLLQLLRDPIGHPSWHRHLQLQMGDCAGGGRFSLVSTKPSLAADSPEAIAKSCGNSAAKVLKDRRPLCLAIPFWLPHGNSWLQLRNAGLGRGDLRYFFWCAGHVQARVVALFFKIIACMVFPQTVCPLRVMLSDPRFLLL